MVICVCPPADLHGTMPGRLLRFDLDAVTTSQKAPSYMEESYVKGIIEEKQARGLIFTLPAAWLAPAHVQEKSSLARP